jgi:hypothetical protein
MSCPPAFIFIDCEGKDLRRTGSFWWSENWGAFKKWPWDIFQGHFLWSFVEQNSEGRHEYFSPSAINFILGNPFK